MFTPQIYFRLSIFSDPFWVAADEEKQRAWLMHRLLSSDAVWGRPGTTVAVGHTAVLKMFYIETMAICVQICSDWV